MINIMLQRFYQLSELPAQQGFTPLNAYKYKLPSLGKPRRATVVPTSFGKRIVTPAYFSR
jgi:hypothetical protein